MPLSLKTFTTTLPKDLIKKAALCTVRECDETEKGKFVAYVDEGKETYDVSLTVSAGKEITASACDCGYTGKTVCRHLAALLMDITKETGPKPVKLAKNKISKAEAALDAADAAEVKEWVRGLLQKNKDLELAFLHRFTEKKQEYTVEEVLQITNDAIKAVVKNKTNLDPTELKKIIDLWAGLHAPIVQYYGANVIDEKAFLIFHTLLESCLLFQQKININSNKISKYAEGLLNSSVESINNLYNEEAYSLATGYFRKYLKDGSNIRMHYLLHLKNIISVSTDERKDKLIQSLAMQYRGTSPDRLYNGALYTKTLFNLVEEHGLFADYYGIFGPISFDNTFNENLIRRLIEAAHLDLAKKYAEEQIKGNYKDVYNIPYLTLLKEIYTLQKEEGSLVVVLDQLLPFTFNFDDYLFLSGRMPEGEEKKKWRTKLISRAKNAARNYNRDAAAFYFKLMDHEKGYKKMIDSVDSYTPYNVILQYFEPMALTDKARLLKAIIDKRDDYGWGLHYEDAKKDKEFFPDLLAAMLKHYRADYLRMALKQVEKGGFYFRGNNFLSYMKNELPALE